MTSIRKTLKSILGRFWLLIFSLSWLIDNIIKLCLFIIAPRIDCFITSIYTQTTSEGAPLPFLFPLQILVYKQSKKASLSVTDIDIGTTSFNLSLSDIWVLTTIKEIPQYDKISTRAMSYQIHYSDIPVDHILPTKIYIKKDPATLNLQIKTIQQEDSLILCYVLWGRNSVSYDVLDRFTLIMELPALWVQQYPGLLQQAYKCHVFGCSIYDALSMLGKVTGFPVATSSGIVTKIDVNNNIVYIDDIPHRGCKEASIAVALKQLVKKGDPLFQDSSNNILPRYFTYEDSDSSFTNAGITALPVITSVGVLNADLALHAVVSVGSTYILPMQSDDSALITAYNNACIQASDKPVVWQLTEGDISVMSLLIHSIWRKHFILFQVPDTNIQDTKAILRHIKNTSSCDSVIYGFTPTLSIYYLQSLQDINKCILYYNTSINNDYVSLINRYAINNQVNNE